MGDPTPSDDEIRQSIADFVTETAHRWYKHTPGKPIDWQKAALFDPPPREWVIEGWQPCNHPLLLSGSGGIGKTLLAQTIGTYIALGRDYFAPIPKARRVLMWACEDDADEIWRRQIKICEHLGVNLLDLIGKLLIIPRFGLENVLFAKVMGQLEFTQQMLTLREQIADAKIDVFILDNIAQVTDDESSRHSVTRFINAFGNIRIGLSTIFLHHPAKTDGSEYSGSTAWENAVRSRWYLGSKLPDHKQGEDEIDDNIRYLCKRKANYSVKDYVRFVYRDGVLVPDTLDGAPRFDAKYRTQRAQELIILAVPRMTEMGYAVSKAPNSQTYLPKIITKLGLHENFPRRELEVAMIELLKLGRLIEREVGRDSSRHRKLGLVVRNE